MSDWMSTGLTGSNYCNSSFASHHIGSTCGNIKALVSSLIMHALTNLFHLPFLKHIWCDQGRICVHNPCSFHVQRCDRDSGAFSMYSPRMKFTSAIIAVAVWGELFHMKNLTWLDTIWWLCAHKVLFFLKRTPFYTLIAITKMNLRLEMN